MRDSVGTLTFPLKTEKIKILKHILRNNKLPTPNFELLQQLLNEHSYDSTTLSMMYSFESALSPIYLYDNEVKLLACFLTQYILPLSKNIWS